MNWKNKKLLPIILSLTLGLMVVLGAAKMTGFFAANKSSDSSPASDAWKTVLSVIPGINTPTRVGKGDAQINEQDLIATTTTDILARRLLTEYTLSQERTGTSTVSDIEAARIAGLLAKEVKLPPKKDYALSDLNISSDNSASAKLSYKNSLTALLTVQLASEQKENVLSIMSTVMSTQDPAPLSKLIHQITSYQQMIESLLALKTPSLAAPIHLHLLQSYETLRSSTVGLQSILSDPAVGVTSVSEYKSGIDALSITGKEYQVYFANQ